MNALFENTLKLRGFLGSDAEVPSSDGITNDAYAVLTLCVESGVWVKAENHWLADTAEIAVICPGPFFCGFTRGMKQGDYIEIDALLRTFEYPEPVVISVDPLCTKMQGIEIYATSIQRLEYPPGLVIESNAG
jgi:hypothetical protein